MENFVDEKKLAAMIIVGERLGNMILAYWRPFSDFFGRDIPARLACMGLNCCCC